MKVCDKFLPVNVVQRQQLNCN